MESNRPEVEDLQKEELICPILLIASDLEKARAPFQGNSENSEEMSRNSDLIA